MVSGFALLVTMCAIEMTSGASLSKQDREELYVHRQKKNPRTVQRSMYTAKKALAVQCTTICMPPKKTFAVQYSAVRTPRKNHLPYSALQYVCRQKNICRTVQCSMYTAKRYLSVQCNTVFMPPKIFGRTVTNGTGISVYFLGGQTIHMRQNAYA